MDLRARSSLNNKNNQKNTHPAGASQSIQRDAPVAPEKPPRPRQEEIPPACEPPLRGPGGQKPRWGPCPCFFFFFFYSPHHYSSHRRPREKEHPRAEQTRDWNVVIFFVCFPPSHKKKKKKTTNACVYGMMYVPQHSKRQTNSTASNRWEPLRITAPRPRPKLWAYLSTFGQ